MNTRKRILRFRRVTDLLKQTFSKKYDDCRVYTVKQRLHVQNKAEIKLKPN